MTTPGYTVDLGDLTKLAAYFGEVPPKVVMRGRAFIMEAGLELRDAWRANATVTAGKHGKWYPRSIQAIPKFGVGLAIDVGPKPGMKQAGMSFEYGSRNQPPHMDGQRALDASLPLIMRRIEAVVAGVF